jgi:hypothetical protein
MSSRPLGLAKAIELSHRITRDDDTIAVPLIELLLGMTDSEGDAARQAIRTAVLKTLYCQTEDFRMHFREYIGESLDVPTVQSNAPAS